MRANGGGEASNSSVELRARTTRKKKDQLSPRAIHFPNADAKENTPPDFVKVRGGTMSRLVQLRVGEGRSLNAVN